MAVEIDSLEINISSNSEDAAKGVAKLTRQLQKLYALTSQDFGLEKLASGLGKMAEALGTMSTVKTAGISRVAKAVSKLGEATKKANAEFGEKGENADESKGGVVGWLKKMTGYGKSVKDIKENVKKSIEPIKKLGKAIGRVALYRAIRAALKAIVQATKEGVQNAYQYSKMMGGDFAKSMDEAASAVLYMKNALGAALMPIIQALTPYLVQFADSFANVANKIAEVMAAFNGSDTFIKAKKSATEYAKAVNEATKATLKFDELNQISNKNENNFADMFETVAVNTNSGAGKVGAWIKQNLAIIASITGIVAVALGLMILFTGNLSIGLGLILLGIGSLHVAAAQIQSDTVSEKIKTIGSIVMGVGGAVFMALGILLCFTPALPTGIALIAAGAAGIGMSIAVNFDKIKGFFSNVGEKFAEIFGSLNGKSLIILGVLVCLNPSSLALGIAMIVEGAKMLKTGTSMSWEAFGNKIVEGVSYAWGKVEGFFKETLPKFFKETLPSFFTGVWDNIWSGFTAGFYTTINGVITGFETVVNLFVKGINKIIDGMNNISIDMPDWLPDWLGGGKHFGIDIANIAEVDFGRISAPTATPQSVDIGAAMGQAVAGAMGEYLSQGGGGGGGTPIILNVVLDGKQIAASVQNANNDSGVQIGKGGIVNGYGFSYAK